MKCTKCNKEAEYIIDGQSICQDHKDNNEPAAGPEGQTAGQRLSGV